ncbi:keratin, type I cytoskeletal 19-like isoform X1 [Syngnathus typhle]|uniref:keratin, type I cytoskeletal 19-like isoform X1 n=1 Tax=Syngnathus typhle TaxID=161592 RepID=UPI002A69D18E|nr:keratin, type I cytoskeletal 19-like isoform X1 [Syngnathus typhle]
MMGGGRCSLLILRRKYKRFCALLTSVLVFPVQVRSSVMWTPRNLVLLTTSTAELLMISGAWTAALLLTHPSSHEVIPHVGVEHCLGLNPPDGPPPHGALYNPSSSPAVDRLLLACLWLCQISEKSASRAHKLVNMSIRAGLSSFSLSSAPVSGARRAASLYSGTSGRSMKMSYGTGLGAGMDMSYSFSGIMDGNNFDVGGSEKATMQNLNDRLATYLDKVRSLESANAQLERQIREWYDRQTPTLRDYSKYEAIIVDLRRKISDAAQMNARLMLQIDNARLAGEDFRIKFENEQAVRMSVEADIAGLRKVVDDLTLSRTDLEMQVEGLKEELVYLKKNHAEEIAALRNQVNSSAVNVEVDARPQEDMSKTIDEIRRQYEAITEKNRRDMDSWYKAKFDELNKQVASSTEILQTSRSEISELQRTLQALQIELQSQLSLKAAVESQLAETESRYSMQLSQLQAMVNNLENELGKMRSEIERQGSEYQILLDIKCRLEMEIAEYRRLLDGENVKTIQIVKEVKAQPVITQRRKVVIEEIIDGKVVSRTEDVDIDVIKK